MDIPVAEPQWFEAAYERSHIGVVIFDADNSLLVANLEARRLLGDGQSLEPELLCRVVAAGHALPGIGAARAGQRGDRLGLHRLGEHDCQLHRLLYRDPRGGVFSVIEIIDITAFHRRERDLLERLERDALTGLASREAFFEAAADLVAERRRAFRPLAVAMIDLDDFKSVNDTAGHAAGDRLLAGIAHCCRRAAREDDVLARLGGDEFAALLPGSELDHAEEVALRMLAGVRHARGTPAFAGAQASISIGMALWRVGETEIGPALDRADRALYMAKAAGGDRVCCHDD